MAEFLKGSHINTTLDDIIENAETELILISPFIKLHPRIKEILRSKVNNDKLKITIVFGKNERKLKKSLSKEDYEFLSQFPHIEIKHEPRLHAKFYANESESLLSSMNLYEFSQNNNIEFGISLKKNKGSLDADAFNYFIDVIENADTIFEKTPQYEERFFGLKKDYTTSTVEVDRGQDVFDIKTATPNLKKKNKQELVSATVLGKEKGLSYKKVKSFMEDKGYVEDDKITALGDKFGLKYKTSQKGDSWIVYPTSLADALPDHLQ